MPSTKSPPTAPAPPSPARPSRVRLTAEDWTRAALAAIGVGGLAAVAVEPIAVSLQTTKGSFYWHFPNREALIQAALELWERERTEAVIAAMETEPDPAARLRRLFIGAVETRVHGHVEVALLATADHPLVAPVLVRVTERRIAYLAQVFAKLGLESGAARSHALLAYSAFLGHLQLVRATPAILPSTTADRRRHLERVLTAMLPASVPPKATPVRHLRI